MKVLSLNNRNNKIILPLALTLLICFILIVALKNYLLFLVPVLFIILALGFLIAKKAYNKNFNAFYDSDFLYLIDKYETYKISLTKIRSVDLTPTTIKIMGILLYHYTIYYKTNGNRLNSYSFMVSTMNINIVGFEKCLKLYSPNTRIDD